MQPQSKAKNSIGGKENKKIIREKKGKKPITIIIKGKKKLKYSQHSVNIYKQNNDV